MSLIALMIAVFGWWMNEIHDEHWWVIGVAGNLMQVSFIIYQGKTMKQVLRQWKLYRMGIEVAPWQRWKVVCDDCRKYMACGCMKLTLTRIGALLWAKRHVPVDRTYEVVRHKPNAPDHPSGCSGAEPR